MNEAIVRIYESELHLILHEVSIHNNIETGGSLLGLWTSAGNPTILLASRPGRRAVRAVTQFDQDLNVHRMMEELLVEHHGVQSIGLWHSHHSLGLHELSGGDVQRTIQFARRSQRSLFCDLLCYFTDSSDGGTESPEITIKPYVYIDAGAGRRVPSSLVVMPGISPIRSALETLPVSARTADELKLALAPAPGDWQGRRWRTARSIQMAQRDDEDGKVEDRGGFWPFRRSRQTTEVGDDSKAPRDGSTSEPTYEIPDLEWYIKHCIEKEIRVLPSSISCELEPIHGGRSLRLSLVTPGQSEQRELDLGWDGTQAVVTRYIVHRANSPGPQDIFKPGYVYSLREVLSITAKDLRKVYGG